MSQLDFDAPLSQYFFEDVSEHLKSNEIYNLDDLMDLIYINDNNWWKSVHLEKETANGILKWLYDHRLEGVELPDSVLKKAIELTKPYYGHKIGVVAGAQFTEVVNPETHFKKVHKLFLSNLLRCLIFLTEEKGQTAETKPTVNLVLKMTYRPFILG